MPVPSTIADLSATASSNYPQGSESPSTLDDYIRAQGAIIRQVSDAKAAAGANNDITSLSGITGQIGTNSAPMTFYTGGSERMRIDASGNVGIGATTPSTGALNRQLTINSGASSLAGVVMQNNTSGTAYNDGFTVYTDGSTGYLINYESGGISFSSQNGGNVVVTSSSGLGYGTGAGGTVTQATSKSTAVTLNKPTGQITMNNAALAAGAAVTFDVINSIVSANDVVILTAADSLGWQYTETVYSVRAGAFTVFIKNLTAGSLSDALKINFAIIKGAVA